MDATNPLPPRHGPVVHKNIQTQLPELDNSEVSHKTISNPLCRRPLTDLCRKEKAIRISGESATDQYRRYGKSVWTLLLVFYRWLFRH